MSRAERSDALARAIIAKHSKSFALASKLLPPTVRDHAVVVYAWCRRADDAVDSVGPSEARAEVTRLGDELDWVFEPSAPCPISDPDDALILEAFANVVSDTMMPRHYPAELLEGMAMDAHEVTYESWEDLLEYCYRVAGTVGLMMSHVMGVKHAMHVEALRNAVHLGMAMQLTNICRDVREDWDRGRLYVPDELLAECGGEGLRAELGRPLPVGAARPLALAIGKLLAVADRLYASGDRGLPALSPRCAWAVRSAREVYSAIGHEVRATGCDVFAPRAVVSKRRKLELVSAAAVKLAPIALRSTRGRVARELPVVEFSNALVETVLS